MMSLLRICRGVGQFFIASKDRLGLKDFNNQEPTVVGPLPCAFIDKVQEMTDIAAEGDHEKLYNFVEYNFELLSSHFVVLGPND